MIIYWGGLMLALSAGLWFVFNPPKNRNWLALLLSAGGAFIIAIIFSDIVPHLFAHLPAQAGYVLLAGFLIQIFLDGFSKGIEHGHAHPSGERTTIIAFVALCFHEFIEGMPLALSLTEHPTALQRNLALGIMLHKIPIAITLALLLQRSGFSKKATSLLISAFILCTVAGSLTQQALATFNEHNSEQIGLVGLGLAVGILLHVSTTILFESSEHHRFSPARVAVIVAGLAAGLLI